MGALPPALCEAERLILISPLGPINVAQGPKIDTTIGLEN
jgi:hypothetical protein